MDGINKKSVNRLKPMHILTHTWNILRDLDFASFCQARRCTINGIHNFPSSTSDIIKPK